MLSTLFLPKIVNKNSSIKSSKKNTKTDKRTVAQKIKKLFLNLHLRFLRQTLLPNMRPVRKTQNGVTLTKGSSTIARWKVTRRSLAQAVLIAILACGSSGLNATSSRESTATYSFNIPAQKVEEALSSLAQQTGHQLLFSYPLVDALNSTAVQGTHTVTRALQQLLQNTTLSGRLTERGVIIVTDARHNSDKGRGNMIINTNKRKNVLASFITLFATGAGAQDQVNESATAHSGIDEIIVTANKREASLQDTAMSISAMTGDTIDKRGLVGMGDYLSSIPGVTVVDRGAGQNSIIIRGLSGDPQTENATAGSYFGETSVSELGSTSSYGGAGNADIKLVDIERVEVLRGPQGTLYGSGSIGGTVRIIPVAPNLEKIEGTIATKFSQTGEEGGDNTMLQGVLNVPLIEDTLAVRAVVYQFDNSGYVKNVAASQPVAGLAVTESYGGIARDRDDVGNDSYTGVRISALWHPIDPLDITLSYLQQKIEQDGAPEVELALAGDYDQRRFNTGVAGSHYESLDNEIDITNLVVEYDVGWASVINSLSLLNYDSEGEQDLTHLYTLFAPFLPGDLADKPYYRANKIHSDNTANELRLISQLEGPLQFSAGLYYEDIERGRQNAILWSGNPDLNTGPIQNISEESTTTRLKQKAVFGELSYNITDQLKATVGGRYFDYTKTETFEVDIFLNNPTSSEPENIDETGQTLKANLSYQVADNLLVYGDWSEGFRLGRGQGENPFCAAVGIPVDDIESDTSENFELGLKSSFADNRITFNASVYQIDWEGIPVFVSEGVCDRILNAGEAKSEGVELELQTYLTESLKIDLSASYNEAKLGANSESIGDKGDNLPGSADVNATLGLQYDFTLQGMDSFARIDYTYLGEYYSNVTETGTPAGNYGQLNLKAGLAFNQIAVDLFVNNATNNDGLSWVSSLQSTVGLTTANRIRPRTIGINMSYQF